MLVRGIGGHEGDGRGTDLFCRHAAAQRHGIKADSVRRVLPEAFHHSGKTGPEILEHLIHDRAASVVPVPAVRAPAGMDAIQFTPEAWKAAPASRIRGSKSADVKYVTRCPRRDKLSDQRQGWVHVAMRREWRRTLNAWPSLFIASPRSRWLGPLAGVPSERRPACLAVRVPSGPWASSSFIMPLLHGPAREPAIRSALAAGALMQIVVEAVGRGNACKQVVELLGLFGCRRSPAAGPRDPGRSAARLPGVPALSR